MLQARASFLVLLVVLVRAMAGFPQPRTSPVVILDCATVTGVTSGSTNQFLGIPFAQPPTGNLRLQLPQALPPYHTDFSATAYGPACPQKPLSFPFPPDLPAETLIYLNSMFNSSITVPSAEDCLTINVITPTSATPTSKLPVVVWIYGGGFQVGASEFYNGSVIVEKAASLNLPAIYVSMNYRVNVFGFLASQEIRDAGVGNLGLQDQRLALRWVQKYISAFGGDPTKVTIWGESAGAISVALHMLTNGGNADGLFRAAFMQSGSILPAGDITCGQQYYDIVVAETGCCDATDTLQCLREVPYEALLNTVDLLPGILSYQPLDNAWVPCVDGVFLTADPSCLVLQGSVVDVPFVNGNCDDEGTLFSFSSLNVTTDAEFKEYIRTYLVPNPSPTTLVRLMSYYPSDPSQGSPFGTGNQNKFAPQFKRIAAFQGDVVFQAPRRFFLQNRSGKQNIWTYVSKRFKDVPLLGAFHGSDIGNVYGGSDMASYLVRFVANLDPNIGESDDLYWPQYDATTNETMLEFLDGSVTQGLTTDTYRTEAMAYLSEVMFSNALQGEKT